MDHSSTALLASPFVVTSAVAPLTRTASTRWVISRFPCSGSGNVTMSPGRTSRAATGSSITRSPTRRTGSMLPESTLNER